MKHLIAELLTEINAYKKAMEHSSPEALKTYLKDHPNADKSKHTVKSDSKSDSSKSNTPSVSDATKSLDSAKKKLEDQDLSDWDIKQFKQKVEYGEGHNVSFSTYGDADLGEATSVQVGNLVSVLTAAKSSTPGDLLKNLDIKDDQQKEDAEIVMGMLLGGDADIPVEALASKDEFDDFAKRMNDSIAQISNLSSNVSKDKFKGDEYGLGHLPEKAKKIVQGLQSSVSKALESYKSNWPDGDDFAAMKEFVDAEDQLEEAKENEGGGKKAFLRQANLLMSELKSNRDKLASLEQRYAGAGDKPRQLQKGTWKVPVGAGHVLLSQWAVKHITAHNDIGTGSVFARGIDERTLIKLIQKAPVKGQGGLYTMKASNVGYNLVLPIEKALQLPNAVETTVQKEERGKKITVPAIQTSASLRDFSTNQISLVIRPSNSKFLPDDAKSVKAILSDVKSGRSYSLLTAFPGDPNIPPSSQWGGKYAVILPSK